jgi:hypothetical protein
VKPRSHLPDAGEVPRVELDRKRDPGWRDRHAVDIATPLIRQRVTQPPPLRPQRCQHPSNLILELTGASGLIATPAGVAPAGNETDPISVSWPPLTVNTPTVAVRLSLTYSVWPSSLSRASTAPTPD